jgi:hypothetical protein
MMITQTFFYSQLPFLGRDEAWGLAASGTAAWYFQNGLIQALGNVQVI